VTPRKKSDEQLLVELLERLGGRLSSPGVLTGELAAPGYIATVRVELRREVSSSQREGLRAQALAILAREPFRACKCAEYKQRRRGFESGWCSKPVAAVVVSTMRRLESREGLAGGGLYFAFVCATHAAKPTLAGDVEAVIALPREKLDAFRARAERERDERWRKEEEERRAAEGRK